MREIIKDDIDYLKSKANSMSNTIYLWEKNVIGPSYAISNLNEEIKNISNSVKEKTIDGEIKKIYPLKSHVNCASGFVWLIEGDEKVERMGTHISNLKISLKNIKDTLLHIEDYKFKQRE